MSKKEKVELSSTRKKRCQRKSTRTLQFSYELLLPPPYRHTVDRLRGNKKWPEIQIGAKWLFLFFFQGETIQQNIQQSNFVTSQSSLVLFSQINLSGFVKGLWFDDSLKMTILHKLDLQSFLTEILRNWVKSILAISLPIAPLCLCSRHN